MDEKMVTSAELQALLAAKGVEPSALTLAELQALLAAKAKPATTLTSAELRALLAAKEVEPSTLTSAELRALLADREAKEGVVPLDPLERKVNLLTKLMKAIFGEGDLKWPRAFVLVGLGGILVFGAVQLGNSEIKERFDAFERIVLGSLKQIRSRASRVECLVLGGSQTDCFKTFPPSETP